MPASTHAFAASSTHAHPAAISQRAGGTADDVFSSLLTDTNTNAMHTAQTQSHRSVRSGDEPQARCQRCRRSFQSFDALNHHVRIMHESVDTNAAPVDVDHLSQHADQLSSRAAAHSSTAQKPVKFNRKTTAAAHDDAVAATSKRPSITRTVSLPPLSAPLSPTTAAQLEKPDAAHLLLALGVDDPGENGSADSSIADTSRSRLSESTSTSDAPPSPRKRRRRAQR